MKRALKLHETHRLALTGYYDDDKAQQVRELIGRRRWRSAELHAHTIVGQELRAAMLEDVRTASNTTQEDDDEHTRR